jgi:hypothetical protein
LLPVGRALFDDLSPMTAALRGRDQAELDGGTEIGAYVVAATERRDGTARPRSAS